MDIESTLEKLGFIMQDPAMNAVKQLIKAAAASPIEVLIQGETGTGKELVVKAIHALNATRSGKLVAVDCSIFEGSQVIESMLFGHKRGAFTGAYEDRPGVFEEAENGFLFLDEIHNMPINQQNKFLRVLQEQQGRRMGCHVIRKYNFRLVCASNKNLQEEVEQNRFKSDLFHRINCITIDLPPLRKRLLDIPSIAAYLLLEESKKFDKESAENQFHKRFFQNNTKKLNITPFDPEVLQLFLNYPWPGNIRELNNEIRHILAYLSVNQQETNSHMIYKEACSPKVRNFNSATYNPKPLETPATNMLPSYALDLTEVLAKNAHDIWAKQRINDGWSFGPTRDDTHKKHPCLIEYENLPDSEKAYDRIMSLGVIKALLALGYTLSKDEENEYSSLFKPDGLSLKDALILFECKMIIKALEITNFDQSKAATLLGTSRSGLCQKLNDTENAIRKKCFEEYRNT